MQTLDSLHGALTDTGDLLEVARNIAVALRDLHRRGVVHGDLRPSHILADPVTKAVRLAPSRDPERGPPSPSPAHLAPERLYRTAHAPDEGSDLYAFGVTLYQLLTGHLPLRASDPLAWVHVHAALEPVPPSELRRELPPMVSSITMKLLAKSREQRYQSAHGVLYDLERCLARRDGAGATATFALGERDLPSRPRRATRLHEREREKGQVLRAFERVGQAGASEVVLLSGPPGIGKSALARELAQALAPPRAWWATGEHDSLRQDEPYRAVRQLLSDLVQSLLAGSERSVAALRDALGHALGAHARVVCELAPDLALIIGETPPVPELPPAEARGRLHAAVQRLIAVVATRERPVVLFLDDVHWADEASLALVQHLVLDPTPCPCLVVMAYREREPGPSPRLVALLDELRRAGPVSELRLAPLSASGLGAFVADLLGLAGADPRPAGERASIADDPALGEDGLAGLLHARTDGNPFFALQFVDSLVERGHIAFDPAGWAWRCDLDAIRAHGPSADVAALVAERLRRVPQPLQALAHLAACLGPHADLERLAALAGLPPAELRDQLQALARDGILTPVGASFRFSHERVRDAALELVPSDERRAMHLAIGRALLAEPASLEQPARAFEIADHIKLCADLVVDAHEREQAARACIVAARAAHAAGSFAAGASYCASGVALLGPAAWREHPAAMFELAFLGARCAWPQGDYDAANRALGELLGRAASRHQRVRLLHERVDLSLARVDIATGYIATVQCLGLFGRSLPLVPAPELVAARHAEVELRLGARAIEALAALPPVADPEVRALLGLLRSFAPIAFAFNRPLRDLAACEMMALTLTHGLSEAAPHAAANYAGFLTETLGRLDEGRRFSSLARALIERPELGAERARVLNFCVLVDAWTCPPKELIELCHVGYQAAVEAGDRVSTCLHAMQLAFGRIAQGRPLGEVLLHAERGLALSRDVAFRYVDDALTAAQRFVMALRGETDDVARLGGADFDEAAFAARLAAQPFGLPVYNYWILAIQARFLGGDLAGAWELAERIADVRNRGSVASPFAPWAGFFGALAAAALVERAAPDARPRMRALLVDEEARLAVLAAHAPHNFRAKHLLLAAERARLDGDHGAVLPLFEAAIRAARESGFVHEEAIGCELAARFLADQAVEIGARAYWRKAHRGYLGWGASGKARLLEAQHPHLAAIAELARAPRAPASDLDMMTLAAASQAIAGELVLDRLVPLLLRVTVESTGARRGHLVLCDGEGLAVHAGFDAASGAHTDEVVATDTPGVLAWSVVRYAQRTLRPVLLDEATADRRFSADAHIVARRPRSVLCVPIVRRREAVGALYLEHDLVAGAFRPERVALVEHLAAQAAVSLENARLFGELRRAEGHVATLTAQTPIALFATDARGVLTEARGRALDAVAPDGSELLGRSLFELYSGVPWVTAAARRALSGEAASASGRIGKASLELELATIRDAGGNIAGLSGIALDITQRARLTADLRRLASELIDAEDKERRRFARDLHDSIGQSLPALKLELETFAATRAEPGIAAVASRLGAIHQQVRTLTFELYPAMLDDLGLLATLEHYGRKLGDEGLAVAVAEVGQRRPLSPERTIFVFRAARELLRNVVKHAGASEAMISLSWQPGVLRLVVADNGRGFDATTPWRGGGLGLFDLRERVAHLGGQLRIDSTPRAGTEVLVDVPLEDPESEAVA